MTFKKEIERISQEFSKIVSDFEASSHKVVVELRGYDFFDIPWREICSSKPSVITVDEVLYYMCHGTMDGYYANPFSRGSIVGWHIGNGSYAQVLS